MQISVTPPLAATDRPEVGQLPGLEDSLEPPPCGFKQPPCLEDLLKPPGLELPWGFRQLVCLEDRLELPSFGGFRLPPGLEDLELSPVPCSSFRADVDAFMPSLLGTQQGCICSRPEGGSFEFDVAERFRDGREGL